MLEILVAIGPLAVLLVLSEVLWRAKYLRGEGARKMLHIIIGSYVASWLYFLTFRQIELISAAMIFGVVISHKYHIFNAINDVKRKTWGDILYAVGIFLAASLTRQPWVFAIAILHMSLADGFAGLIGTNYGSSNQYRVFGSKKSWAGTVAFILVSYALLIVFAQDHVAEISLAHIMFVPLLAATIENFGVRGFDNVLLPVALVLLFR